MDEKKNVEAPGSMRIKTVIIISGDKLSRMATTKSSTIMSLNNRNVLSHDSGKTVAQKPIVLALLFLPLGESTPLFCLPP
jgi:hypothetical protein